ncbi:MAG: hypothetical protein E7256_17470 [Lachnospiraceae bacterium]|nr:hypothetical protein [Lachnospiraceae bacterium]
MNQIHTERNELNFIEDDILNLQEATLAPDFQEAQRHLLDKELSFLSRCFSQNLIRCFQSIALILYITYAMIHGLKSLAPFYILAVINLLPYILYSMAGNHSSRRIRFFPQLNKKLRLQPERYHTNRYASAFVTFLLLLWQLIQTRTAFAYAWLTWYPIAIAVITISVSLFGPYLIHAILKNRLKKGRI